MPLPPFVDGVLPVRPVAPEINQVNAVYGLAVLEFTETFGSSPHRRWLLANFFRLRAELRRAGFTVGFQWVNGSFVGEPTDDAGRPREPNDIDVVSFVVERQLVPGTDASQLVKPQSVANFGLDNFLVPLDWPPVVLLRNTLYWYEFWSARRNPPSSRKGFVELNLAEDDAAAVEWLQNRKVEAGDED